MRKRTITSLTLFIESWTRMLWDAMGKTGKGYRYPPMLTPGGKRYTGAKIRRMADNKTIGTRGRGL